MEALLVWSSVSSVQWSQKLEVPIWTKGAEHEVEKVDEIFEGLWLSADVPTWEGERSSRCFEQEVSSVVSFDDRGAEIDWTI